MARQTEAYHRTDEVKPPQTPRKLKALNQWMGTIFERRPDGKTNKSPYRVRSGRPIIKADKTDSANHTTYSEAKAALDAGLVDAIGVVLTEADPYYCCDLDSV